MTNSLTIDPLDLRHRAEEARAKADRANDPGARKTFLGVAKTYDQLAQRAEGTMRKLHPPDRR